MLGPDAALCAAICRVDLGPMGRIRRAPIRMYRRPVHGVGSCVAQSGLHVLIGTRGGTEQLYIVSERLDKVNF